MAEKIDLSARRNIGIVAHVDAGKTTVTEYMLYTSGRLRSLGSVDKGTTHTDWLDIERERGISVRAAATSFTWKNIFVNLIDTPGHVDFSAEVERSLRVLDGAVLLISAVEGVQAQTEVLWNALRKMRIPSVIFINKIDRSGSDISRVLDEIHSILSPDIVPVQQVLGEATAEPHVINIFSDKFIFEPGNAGESPLHGNMPAIVEFMAGLDDEVLQEYVNHGSFPPHQLYEKLIKYTQSNRVFPVLFGAALKGTGITELMNAIIDFLPAPVGEPEMPISGVIFKVEHDKTMGRIAYIRLYNGTMKNRDLLYNVTQDIHEKVAQIRRVSAQKHEDTGILYAGDIASVCGLSNARIGDIIGNAGPVPQEYRLSEPVLKVQVLPGKDTDYTQLVSALQELADEDPLLDLQWLKDERELHIKIMGLIQLEVLTSILKSRFNVCATFGNPSVIYKETPSKTAEGFVSYTMPKPCWAVLRFKIEPAPRGSGLTYSSVVRDEDILLRYQHQVEKTIPEALQQGLHGWEVIDLKITLIAGEYHVMHTHPLDFIVATPMAVMDGLANTGTKLLEPMLRLRISVPEEAGNKVLSDIIQMRGDFDSPIIAKNLFTVEAHIPVASSLHYATRLGIISGGRGNISTRFAGYKECPLELGATAPRRGITPLDQAKYILSARKALANM